MHVIRVTRFTTDAAEPHHARGRIEMANLGEVPVTTGDLALLLAGLALVGDALWPLLAVIPAVWIIQTQVIAREEPYLSAKFGAPYADYRKRVRRWL